jgi:hypothetical protein
VPGDYASPVINKKRDIMNLYGDTGAPDYLPVDLNAGVDITRLVIPPFTLENGTYAWRLRYRDHNLKWSEWSDENTFTFTGIHDNASGIAGLRVAPNPVGQSTKISFETRGDERVTLKIYSLDNREVAVILNNRPLAPGAHEYVWEADSNIAAGVYILKLTSRGHTETAKLILMKR